ncbi:MAG: serine hydrolase domain-containing protein [Clostridiaceae bacterium]
MTQSPHEQLDYGVRYLVNERRVITGIAVSYGGLRGGEQFCHGAIREVRLQDGAFVPDHAPMDGNSIFDLASVTKLFTCIAVLQLCEKGKLSLSSRIGQVDKRFLQIADVTIEELLSFRTALQTAFRIDTAESAEAAQNLLFNIRTGPAPTKKFYTDMGAMVLKYVIESAADLSFWEYLEQNILRPLNMNHTFADVPEALLPNTVCYNYERTVAGGQFRVDTGCPAGTIHDPKARLLRTIEAGPFGHAGLFSTLPDMTLLAGGLLQNALLSRKTLLSMGVNRTGSALAESGYSQYMGYLCYSKHPVQTFSEVPASFGERAIALNGFTGNHFSVDPEQNRYMILLANRIHNRVTVLTGRADPNDHTETVRWDDGHAYVVSQNFVYMKDKYLKNTIGELLKEY